MHSGWCLLIQLRWNNQWQVDVTKWQECGWLDTNNIPYLQHGYSIRCMAWQCLTELQLLKLINPTFSVEMAHNDSHYLSRCLYDIHAFGCNFHYSILLLYFFVTSANACFLLVHIMRNALLVLVFVGLLWCSLLSCPFMLLMTLIAVYLNSGWHSVLIPWVPAHMGIEDNKIGTNEAKKITV